MLTFAHFRFKQFIKHKALQCGKVVIDVNEAYTSQTVSWTGEVKLIGSARFISSGKGKNKVVVDRDYNGARGIMLRALRASSLQII
jgi:putative transposase